MRKQRIFSDIGKNINNLEKKSSVEKKNQKYKNQFVKQLFTSKLGLPTAVTLHVCIKQEPVESATLSLRVICKFRKTKKLQNCGDYFPFRKCFIDII